MLPRWAVAVWAVILILIVIGLRVALSPRSKGVYPIFSTAGRHWQAAEPVYVPPTAELDVFRYSPPVAAFFSLWSRLPDLPAGLIWRGLNLAVYVAGLAAWCRRRRPALSLPAVMLLVIPLAVGGLNNGQCNALVTGLLLLAHVAFDRQRFFAAAALIATAGLFKGYPIAYGLLLCLLEPRRFTQRLGACLLVGAALPYLCQPAGYVGEQYICYFQRLDMADRSHFALEAGWRDLHMLIRRVGIAMDLNGYRLLETELGFLCAAAVLILKYRSAENETRTWTCLATALCWMTLAGPATESCTYVLISPIFAQSALGLGDRQVWRRWLVGTSYALFTAAAVSVWFPGKFAGLIQATALQPLAALLLTIDIAAEYFRTMCPRSAHRGAAAEFGQAA